MKGCMYNYYLIYSINMADSYGHMAETKTKLKSNYLPIKINFKNLIYKNSFKAYILFKRGVEKGGRG